MSLGERACARKGEVSGYRFPSQKIAHKSALGSLVAFIRILEYTKSVVAAVTSEPAPRERWELYRLLSEPIRLKLLALAFEEELGVGELAELLDEAQPNISRHISPLRQGGLVTMRKQGTRALVRLADSAELDPVVADALEAGRALCRDDGSLDRIGEVVRARDAPSRAFFARVSRGEGVDTNPPPELAMYLAALAPLISERRLAVDVGTGDGSLLEVIAPIFDHVVAFDREEAQLTRCRARLLERGFGNVAVVRGEAESDDVVALVHQHGGADVVFAARFLHHAPRPASAVKALAKLLKPGGALLLIDYVRHDDESMRDQADLWLGFDAAELKRFARGAALDDIVVRTVPLQRQRPKTAVPDAHLPFQIMVARRPVKRPRS
ncbi:MAG: hypothetical protein NVSMB1_26650 [Polyangiales bacterium]